MLSSSGQVLGRTESCVLDSSRRSMLSWENIGWGLERESPEFPPPELGASTWDRFWMEVYSELAGVVRDCADAREVRESIADPPVAW
jgi:hypothetical protein